jgi:hypothetical protein
MGGKGSGGGGAPQYDKAEGAAYLERNPDVYEARMDPWQHYQTYGRSEGREWGIPQPESPSPFEMYSEQMASQSKQLAEAQAQAAAEAKKQQEALLRERGESDRDQLYSGYMDAANSAADNVNSEIADESSNARLLGVEYDITDDQKQQRIGDYFATLWGEGQQSQLEGLMDKWGKPKGFEGFSVARGDGSKYEGKKKGEKKSVSQSKGVKPKIILDEEDDADMLGGSSILGV